MSTPASSMRSAAWRTARPSRTARACRISTASSSLTRRTRAPRWGSRTTSPSCSRRMSAVRTAPRDMSNVVRDVRLDEAGVGRDVTADDGLAEGVVARGDRHRRHAYCRMVAKIVNNSVFMSASIADTQDRCDCGARGVSEPVVAVLGLGEAGGRLAADLVAAGVEVRGYDPSTAGPRRASISRASTPSRRSPVATSCSPDDRVDRARRGRVGAARPRAGAIYADLNTASPALKREIADARRRRRRAVRRRRAARPGPRARARTLRSSRPAPAHRRSRSSSGRSACPSRSSPTEPGDAAALKLLRSVFMKGLAASVVESLRAAEAVGRRRVARGGDRGGDRRAATSSARSREAGMHAVRRVDEMEAARELLLELGVEPHDRRRERGAARRSRGDEGAIGSSS